MPQKKLDNNCLICGEPVKVTVTEDGKLTHGGQYKGTKSRPRHNDCARQRAIEERNHNPNLR